MNDTCIEVKQKKSIIGQSKSTRLVMKGLGLSKIGRVRVLKDTLAIRGMVEKVQHLVEVSVRACDKK